MNQISVSVDRTLKEFIRDKVGIISTLVVPLFFLILFPLTMLDMPEEVSAQFKGYMTITMTALLIMTAGQANLAGLIAGDREKGLYRKMASMPVKLWREGIGRVVATWIFSLAGVIVLLLVGLIYGATFNYGLIVFLESLGLGLLIAISSVGTGLIIASFVKGESAATHVGIAIALLTFFLGGMALPFSDLPEFIQGFAKIHPVSSATASMAYILVGKEFAGYNPLYTGQIILTAILSLFLFTVGLISYSRYCWKKQ